MRVYFLDEQNMHYPERLMISDRFIKNCKFSGPLMQLWLTLIVNHNSVYTFMINVTNDTNCDDGWSIFQYTYSLNMRFAKVRHLECTIFPGCLFAKASVYFPSEIA
jgi:hypothetical protein